MNTKRERATPYFTLMAWCTATKAWREEPGRYESAQDSERTATEQGTYRVVYVCDGLRRDLEPCCRIGDG